MKNILMNLEDSKKEDDDILSTMIKRIRNTKRNFGSLEEGVKAKNKTS